MTARSAELKNTTYEVFMAALSVLSVANGIVVWVADNDAVDGVLIVMNGLFTVAFIADFVYRLLTAQSKRDYVLHQYGWADLLSSLPTAQLKFLRVFRVLRAVRAMRRVGIHSIRAEFTRNRASSALLSLLLLLFLLLEFGGLAMVAAESGAPEANITTGGDAIWYTYVTMTTVGYGDKYPVTSWGRAIGMVIMAAGVGLFGTLTGYLANAFLSPKKKDGGVVATVATGTEGTLVEMRALVATSRKTQEDLEAKLAELEQQLVGQTRAADVGGQPGPAVPDTGA